MNRSAYIDGYLYKYAEDSIQAVPQKTGLYTVDRPIHAYSRVKAFIKNNPRLANSPMGKRIIEAVDDAPSVHRSVVYVAPKGTKIAGRKGIPHGDFEMFVFDSQGTSSVPKASATDWRAVGERQARGIASARIRRELPKAQEGFDKIEVLRKLPFSDMIMSTQQDKIDTSLEDARKRLREGASQREMLASVLGGAGHGIGSLLGFYQLKAPAWFPGVRGAMMKPGMNQPANLKRFSDPESKKHSVYPMGAVDPKTLSLMHRMLSERVKNVPWAAPGSKGGYSCVDYGNSLLCGIGKKPPETTSKTPWRKITNQEASGLKQKPSSLAMLPGMLEDASRTAARTVEDLPKKWNKGMNYLARGSQEQVKQ